MQGFISVKLEMSKAFDRVECDYLEQIMYALDFHPKWIYLGMKFVNI